MTTRTTAAIFTGVGQPLRVECLDLAPPRAGEVQVRMVASGVCHTDWSTQNGTMPSVFPMVLGHEGAGVVEAVGTGVTSVSVGDHVVLSFVAPCGACYWCGRGQPFLCQPGSAAGAFGVLGDFTPRLSRPGSSESIYQMGGLGTFSERAVVAASAAVPIRRDIPLDLAALLGCAVLTGIGAAMHTASITAGDCVVVIGCGGVGLSVIQGACLAGADRIVAVDRGHDQLTLATKAGATHTLDARVGNVADQVRTLTGGRGGDVVFEVVGSADTIALALDLTRRGGEAVIVGVPGVDVELRLPVFTGLVYEAKTVKGCWYGSCDPGRDLGRLVDQFHQGLLHLDSYVTRRIGLDGINDAFASMAAGQAGRSLVML